MAEELDRLVAYLDTYLDVRGIEDSSLNGLQVEGVASVERVGVAVDAAAATVEEAVEGGCQMMLVHHGLFWGGPEPLTGRLGATVRSCFAAELSIYAAHLPLDRHQEVGNNAVLGRKLGGVPVSSFGEVGGEPIGLVFRLTEPCAVADLAGRLAAAGCAEPLIWDFGPERIERLAVITGAGCSMLDEAVAAGADAFVTGEPRQAAYHHAREEGIHCLFGGHYDTETYGVRALGDHLEERFDVEILWIDHPTGV